jgi:hypothetical protein
VTATHSAEGVRPEATNAAAPAAVQQRVLWLATPMVHHANRVHPNMDVPRCAGAGRRACGSSAYFRLSKRPIDQRLAAVPREGPECERRHRQAMAGATRCGARGPARRHAGGAGAVIPEVLAAAGVLEREAGMAVDVLCRRCPTSSPRAAGAAGAEGRRGLDPRRLLPEERRSPIVAVLDGHPHTLAFLGAVDPVSVSSWGRRLRPVGRRRRALPALQHGPKATVGAALHIANTDESRPSARSG